MLASVAYILKNIPINKHGWIESQSKSPIDKKSTGTIVAGKIHWWTIKSVGESLKRNRTFAYF